MMKRWLKATLAGALVAAPIAGFAAIDNTHHDVVYMLTSTVTTEKCAYCHSLTSLATVSGTHTYKSVGSFCVAVCHVSTSGMAGSFTATAPAGPGRYSGNAVPLSFTAGDSGATGHNILDGGHGMAPGVIDTSLAPDTATAVAATGWPHTTAGEMECTSCHSVHDATNPPFLNAKLSTATSPNTDGFCQRCHTGGSRAQDFTTAGDHPTEFAWSVSSAAGRAAAKTVSTATIMAGREIDNYGANIFAEGAGTHEGADAFSNLTTGVWDTGGHTIDNTTGFPSIAAGAVFSCSTCHSAHQNQNFAGTAGANALALGTNLQGVCYGCHNPEPGITGYGHPMGTEVSVSYATHSWTIPIANGTAIPAIAKPAGYGSTAGVSPWCVTCHDIHGADADLMAIRNIDTQGPTDSVCMSCHVDSFSDATADSHHPGLASRNYNTWADYPTQTAWKTPDNLGVLTDGLSCPDCHIGDGTLTKRATAHNWN